MESKIENRFKPEVLKDFAQKILISVNVPELDAQIISESLIDADLRGISSHGFLRLGLYVERIECGAVNPVTEIARVNDKGSTVVLDANNGFGQIAGVMAMDLAIQRAAEKGIVVVVVRNSHHFGTAAYYSLMAVAKDMIGLVMTNAAPLMPPIGGLAPAVGTNPISIAIPTDEMPIVLDMSCSAVAQGKIVAAREEGEKVPLGWGLDKDGTPTEEPSEILDEGLILPAAGHKGFGLALIVDILTGGLGGGALGKEVNSIYKRMNEPNKVSHLFGAININNFISISDFKKRVSTLVRDIRSGRKIEGVEKILMPGEIEYENLQNNLRLGVPLVGSVCKELERLGQKYKVRFPKPD